MTSKIIAAATVLALTAAFQDAFAADVDCKAVQSGIKARYVPAPSFMPKGNGKILDLTLSGEAYRVTGIDRISFNLPHNAVIVDSEKKRSAFPLSSEFMSEFVKGHLDPGNLRCIAAKGFFFSCESSQSYEPSLAGEFPDTVFAPSVRYQIGPCEGTASAPKLKP